MTTTPFQTPAWRGAAVRTGRFVDATVVVESAGREVVLPALRRRGLPGVASLPVGWGFGGVVAPDGIPVAGDVAAVVAELGRRGVRSARLRPPPRQDAAFEESGVDWSRVLVNHSYELDLAAGWPAVSAGFASSVRRAVRKAERSGVVVERRTDREAMAEFHRLHRLSVLRWAEGTRVPGRVMQARAALAEPMAKYDAVTAALGTGAACGWHAMRASSSGRWSSCRTGRSTPTGAAPRTSSWPVRCGPTTCSRPRRSSTRARRVATATRWA